MSEIGHEKQASAALLLIQQKKYILSLHILSKDAKTSMRHIIDEYSSLNGIAHTVDGRVARHLITSQDHRKIFQSGSSLLC
jgi:hypothetical protein